MISEISLGGHGGTTDADRVPVLEKAVEMGINYVDNNIAEECDLYGSAMAKSSSAGRDKWFIGFASWPQKITTEYEDESDARRHDADDRSAAPLVPHRDAGHVATGGSDLGGRPDE